MNYLLELLVSSIALMFLLNVIFIRRIKPKSTGKEAPEPDGAWPIIGHLRLLTGDNQLHHTLGAMAEKYGPAFNIRQGTKRAFVVSSWEVAKECFTINDKSFGTRPKTALTKHTCYNHATFSFAPSSPYWREMRKIVVLEVLSDARVHTLKDVRSLEIDSGIRDLYKRWTDNAHKPVVVGLSQWLEPMMFNIIVRIVAGKRHVDGDDEAARCKKAVADLFWLGGKFVLSDTIPFLRWFDLHGYEKQMVNTARGFDSVLGGWLDEHRRQKKVKKDATSKDFIDIMLALEDEGKLSNFEHDSDTCIKSTCMALIVAGSGTIIMTLTWAISLLLSHPNVLKKLQHEVDEHVGKERKVEESDIKNLVFLQAIIKETFRLYPPAPLLGPREAMEDCTVAGYNVKAGTRLIVNLSKIQRDERVWSDPSKFQPERFMDSEYKHVDLRGQQFILVPFGYGRRSCPGVTFALQEIHLTLARLVHSFDLSHAGDVVDMTEGSGLTVAKKKPLDILLTPRLPSRLYGC